MSLRLLKKNGINKIQENRIDTVYGWIYRYEGEIRSFLYQSSQRMSCKTFLVKLHGLDSSPDFLFQKLFYFLIKYMVIKSVVGSKLISDLITFLISSD